MGVLDISRVEKKILADLFKDERETDLPKIENENHSG